MGDGMQLNSCRSFRMLILKFSKHRCNTSFIMFLGTEHLTERTYFTCSLDEALSSKCNDNALY
eukprot:575130-Amphidinium_carterae.1